MSQSYSMSGRCHWSEGTKWVTADVPKAFYRPEEHQFVADYTYGGTKGRLDVRGEGGDLSGIWDKGNWTGKTRLFHTSGGTKHVFIGTWEGEGGPGVFIFDLDELEI